MTDNFAKYLALCAVSQMRPVKLIKCHWRGKQHKVIMMYEQRHIGIFLNVRRAKDWARQHHFCIGRIKRRSMWPCSLSVYHMNN